MEEKKTLVEWYLNKTENIFVRVPSLRNHYIDMLKYEPEKVLTIIREDMKYSVPIAIESGVLGKFDFNASKDEVLVDIFSALKQKYS